MPHDMSCLNVSRETSLKFDQYVKILFKWNEAINLVRLSAVEDVWKRHIYEGVHTSGLSHKSGDWYDFGSGAGFPGIVVSIIRGDTRKVILIESDSRKCSFLRNVRRELDLNIEVINSRAENLRGHTADTISARALAPLKDLLSLTASFRTMDTEHVFPKGRNWLNEVNEARIDWDFSLEPEPSLTEEGAAILRLTNVRQKRDAS